MKHNILYIPKGLRFSLLLAVMFLSCSCSSEENSVPHKGATLPIMQGIADNVPYIQSVEKEESYDLHDGIHITDVTFTYCTKPTRMIIGEIDLTKNITLVVSTPDDKAEIGKKVQRLTEQAMKSEAGGRKVLFGTNGDFCSKSTTEADTWIPGGLVYKDGVALWTKLGWEADHAFYILDDGTAHITSIDEFRAIEGRVQQALSGWQRLLVDGQTLKYTVADISMTFHPRTFVGVSKDNKKIYLFVLDGRQPEYSNGMRLEDMMLLCQGAGCYSAINIDGGGSTTMVRRVEKAGSPVSFEIMNKPSDVPSREVLNGLLVIEKNN